VPRAPRGRITVAAPITSPLVAGTILIAEIPKGGRWKQANFDLKTFTEYFGLDPEHKKLIVLTRLRPNGSVEDVEVRQSVSVPSQNYRVELGAASGLQYPTGASRPIAVFVGIGERQFRYSLLMPGSAGYASAAALLDSRRPRSATRLRREVFTPADVASSWPNSPVLVPPAEGLDEELSPD